MGRKKDRKIVVIELAQQIPHLPSGKSIHTSGWLIQQQDLRLCQQSPADHQFSFHTTGKFSHCPSAEIDQTTKFQQFFCLFPDFFPGHKVQPSLIFHHLIHRHVLTHGILLGNDTDLSFQSGIFP